MKYILSALTLLPFLALSQTEKGVSPVKTTIGSIQSGSTYAVVVGISDYQDEGIPDLRFADKDAEAFANFLQSPAGGNLDEDHLKVLLNEQATQARFAATLDWLWEMARENDRVIIYFSGHGDVEKKSITNPGYLLCWDAPGRVYMAGGAFDVRVLKDVVSTISLQNKAKVVLITDACRSGKLSGSAIGGAQATAANLSQQFANEIKILSCQPDEYSIEGEQWGGGRGAFSFHLLNGLYGMADGNSDGNVSLKEIGRYLEDHVTEEVAPENQNPMTSGSNTENIAVVHPDLLAQLKTGQKGQLQMFATTSSRGIEEEVLAGLDTNIVELYFAFQKLLKEKQFLAPANACADSYFQQLIAEPGLQRLHSAMTRNYAVALQDDAQQVMNKWLKADSKELGASETKQTLKYQQYPRYLERAAALLGEHHYMFPILQARKFFFEGYLMHIDHRHADRELGENILANYRESLKWQPESPHVYYTMMMVQFQQMMEMDSAEYYAHLATKAAPTWMMPYSTMGFLFAETFNTTYNDRAKHYLELADRIDSTAARSNVWHLTNWSSYYINASQFTEAEKLLKQIQQLDSTYINAFNNLGNVYLMTSRWADAEAQYKKVIAMDSTAWLSQSNLGMLYDINNRFEEAEIQYKKTIALDSTNLAPLIGMTRVYIGTGRYEEAKREFEKIMRQDSLCLPAFNDVGMAYIKAGLFREAEKKLQKAILVDSTFIFAISNLGNSYEEEGRYEEAEKQYRKAVKIDSTFIFCTIGLGRVFKKTGRYDKAEAQFRKAIQLDSTFFTAYNELGDCFLKTNRYDEAEQQFRKALRVDSLNAVALGYLGLLYVRNGQYSKAAASLQKSLSIDPNNKYTLMNFALLYSLQNQMDKAFDYLEKALKKGYKFNDTHIDMKEEPGFAVLRGQQERWEALIQKYFPEQTKD